jgi:MarR-like DNA-binding transcriptional regulator SgrR of sgrS sRNA
MRTLNPATPPLDDADAAARRVLFPLIFETLVAPGTTAGPEGVLAESWHSNAATEWQFRLRRGVRLHDGTPLDGARIAAALRAREPGWQIASDATSITITTDRAVPDLPWQLADTRYAIAFARPGGGEPIGSGPFAIERWEPKRLRLRAHEDHWRGRPFLDAVSVDMGRPIGGQIEELELGRADFATLRVEDVRRASNRGLTIAASAPRELVALVFAQHGTAAASIRQALALAIDRRALWSALLQRQGEPGAGLLPGWISGYSGLFAHQPDRVRARAIVAALPAPQRRLTLLVAPTGPLVRSIAERVAVDARDAGLTIDVNASGTGPAAAARVMRIGIDATTPDRALAALLQRLNVDSAAYARSLDEVYRAEQALVDDAIVVPLVHVPELYAAGSQVESWSEPIVLPWGAWNFANLWLKAGAR